MSNAKAPAHLHVAKSASHRSFPPPATVKCDGPSVFRSQTARDVACLLDINPDVTSWVCMPMVLEVQGKRHVPDFAVYRSGGAPFLVDAPDQRHAIPPETIEAEAIARGWRYRMMDRTEVYGGFGLRNSRDLLKYGAHVAALGDRVRLLAALDEHGSLPFSECLSAFQEGPPVAGLASLILFGFLEVELYDAPIGPETLVRRIRL